jgi:hypothetical protein
MPRQKIITPESMASRKKARESQGRQLARDLRN